MRNGRARSLRPGLPAASVLLLVLAGACSSASSAQSGPAASTAIPAATSPPASVLPSASAGAGTSNPLAPPSTPAPGLAVPSDLLLTGALSGRVQNAQPLGPCGPGPAGFAVSLRFALGGATTYILSVDVLDYRGAGRYSIPPERVAVRSDQRSGTPTFLPATSGTVEVAGGESSGKLDVQLGSDGVSRVWGSWACR